MRECKQKSATGISSGAFLLLPMMVVLLLRIRLQQAHSLLLAPPPPVALMTARQECRRLSRRYDRHASSFLSSTTASSTTSSTTNPRITQEWKDASNSSFAKHVILEDPDPIMAVDAVDRVLASIVPDNDSDDTATTTTAPLNASQLIAFGSVWYLPSCVAAPAATPKPTRLPRDDFLLQRGDYLRVHHDPRRFPAVHAYDWGGRVGDDGDNEKEGVIVAADPAKGWLVLDKPANVPVHPTVDNQLENVAACVREARHNNDDNDSSNHLPYVATPQRLDINTSGLLVVATSKPFAAYFASLLRSKTKQQLVTTGQGGGGDGDGANNNETTSLISSSSATSIGGIHKVYRCLVCLVPPASSNNHDDDDDTSDGTLSSWSVNAAAKELQSYAETGKILRHYLEPSIRAPKRFVAEPPPDEDWPECLLKIRTASPVYALVGNEAGRNLRQALWTDEALQIQDCAAVMELEIELLTGRTHQIRGQCAVVGCPLVGDVQYGGARTVPNPDRPDHNIDSERLALQCCELEFLDPELDKEKDGSLTLKRGSTWNRFRLERAWWTPLLERYEEEEATRAVGDVTTTSAQDHVGAASESSSDNDVADGAVHAAAARPELLPPRVQLSPGQHKYVLIRATHPGNPHQQDVQWFVKSAAPSECGGPYHGNVAQDLREWIEAAGYKAVVTGGGRINYRRSEGRAVVYGFSFGFGKGDHAKAAALIREWSDGAIEASYDNAEGLY